MYTYVKGKGWLPEKSYTIDGKTYRVELRLPDPSKGELGCYTGAEKEIEWWADWFAKPDNIEYMQRNIHNWVTYDKDMCWAALIPLEQ